MQDLHNQIFAKQDTKQTKLSINKVGKVNP